MEAISLTAFDFPGQKSVYHGKVRDVYDFGEQLVIIASDRISAFDHILPRSIPFKGQVLNQISAYFLDSTKDIVPNWLIAVPDPNISVGIKCEPIKIEMVIRGYLTGHAWREYKSGKKTICGVPMPEGMRQNQAFSTPIITPATKADEGHDEDISREEIIRQQILPEEVYKQLENYTRALFQRGTEMAASNGLILVDTKYEFGFYNGDIYLIDEIHTPDSSRYFYADEYEERLRKDLPQRQLSKEFVREWLMENGFQGLEGQQMPQMPDDFVSLVTERYIELFEKLTGLHFEKADVSDVTGRIRQNVQHYLSSVHS